MFKFTPQDLRRHLTPSEYLLWGCIRARRMLGLKFRRQHAIGPFIVDFVCLSHKIIIEVDGAVHIGREEYDQERDEWLSGQGYSVIRIRNEEITHHREETLLKIRKRLLSQIL